MELRHLRYFVAVAEELHFARAAARLGMEQSPLSRAIKDLEQDLGVSLFERTTRSTRLTFPGEVFLRDARSILANVLIATQSAREAADGRKGRLRLSLGDGLATDRVSRFLAGLRVALPEVELRLLELPSAQQLASLRAGQLDLSIMLRDVDEDDHDLRAVTLWSEPLAVALPANHPLAAAESVDVGALTGQATIMCHPDLGSGCHDQLMDVLRSAGVEPHVVEYALLRSTMLLLVAAGFGLGFTTLSSDSNEPMAGVVLRPLNAPTSTLAIYGVSRSEGAPASVEVALRVAASLG